MSDNKCPTCGKNCGWMNRYLYRCKESLGGEREMFYKFGTGEKK